MDCTVPSRFVSSVCVCTPRPRPCLLFTRPPGGPCLWGPLATCARCSSHSDGRPRTARTHPPHPASHAHPAFVAVPSSFPRTPSSLFVWVRLGSRPPNSLCPCPPVPSSAVPSPRCLGRAPITYRAPWNT
jgi:hypothetical protein